MRLALLGAGRMGQVHAANIARHPSLELAIVADTNREAASALATRYGAKAVDDPEAAVAAADVAGVIVCTSTNTHVTMIELAARHGRPVLCEKPIDLDLARVDRCLDRVREARIPLMIGFNRRFDPSFRALKQRLAKGEVGRPEIVKITSRDPAPPPRAYVEVSGGLFRDMTIHDLDMVRYLLDDEPTQVTAVGSALIDPSLTDLGDVDTAMVTLRMRGGTLCHIENSRRAVYGYDQRIEVLGAKGMLLADNVRPTTVVAATEAAVTLDKPQFFFLERYSDAYRAELDQFAEVLAGRSKPSPDGADGRAALVLANAATRSLVEGRPVAIE